MDVKNAFLSGDIAKEVYMHPPFMYSHSPKNFCLFCHDLYGFKQAFCTWFANSALLLHNLASPQVLIILLYLFIGLINILFFSYFM